MQRFKILLPTAGLMALATLPVLADVDNGVYGGRHHWDAGMGWFMGPVMMLVVFGAVLLVAVLLIRGLGQAGPDRSDGRRGAIEILRERFARGEIDREEFEQRRQALSD